MLEGSFLHTVVGVSEIINCSGRDTGLEGLGNVVVPLFAVSAPWGGAFLEKCTLHFRFCSEINSSFAGKSFRSPLKIKIWELQWGWAVPLRFTSDIFYCCKSGIWKLECEAEVCSSQMNYVALREGVGGWMKEREGDSGIFSPANLPICLEILPPGWRPAPGQGLWVRAVIFLVFLFLLVFLFFPCLFSYHCMGAGRQKQGCTLSIQAVGVNKQPDREWNWRRQL